MRDQRARGKPPGVLRWAVVPDTPRTLTADRGDAGRRLDLVLRRHLTDVHAASRTRVQAWIEGGLVAVNGTPVRRVAARVALGAVVSVRLPGGVSAPSMAADDAAIDVLHEDDHLLVVNKLAGVVVHPTYKHVQGTLMNALLGYARHWAPGERPSLLGRLDKLTSGLVVVAKSAAAHTALQRTLASGESDKDYLALVYGRVNVARGRIDLPLGRDVGDRRRVVVADTGSPSVTLFERIGRVPAPRVGLSLLRCRLVTGRTHQIRVHLAARGWPIVGDPVYGSPREPRVDARELAAALAGFPRQALHAWRVGFVHPWSRQHLVVEAPVPADMAALLEASGLAAGLTAARTRPTVSAPVRRRGA
ncbi:MAG: RluA family pseudouridine synthase [Acidobacteriota bacterium]